jgi:DnaJ-class molecular chaperone
MLKKLRLLFLSASEHYLEGVRMTFEEFDQARRLFGLPERATLNEIKTRHRLLAKRFHPDRGEGGNSEQMRQVNAAYRLLKEYCSSYRFSMTREEFFEQNPEERLREQFAQDAIWRG